MKTGNFCASKSFLHLPFHFHQWNPLIAHSLPLFSLLDWSHYMTSVADNECTRIVCSQSVILSVFRRKLLLGLTKRFCQVFLYLITHECIVVKVKIVSFVFTFHHPFLVYGLVLFENASSFLLLMCKNNPKR